MAGWKVSSGLLELQNRDQEKRNACESHGIMLVEIPYTWNKTIEFVIDAIDEKKRSIN